ncbi:MAG: translation elongation factor-like protein [Candidatus Doudnabacteria bacterium]|nr:translation elongation factor-like protein [Candidatus Doudnabacteria bacterium]
MAEEKPIGKVVHYYDKAMVAIIELTAPLKVGQTIHFKGGEDDVTQVVNQMQFDRADIQEGVAGQRVGVKVDQKVRDTDQVFLAE